MTEIDKIEATSNFEEDSLLKYTNGITKSILSTSPISAINISNNYWSNHIINNSIYSSLGIYNTYNPLTINNNQYNSIFNFNYLDSFDFTSSLHVDENEASTVFKENQILDEFSNENIANEKRLEYLRKIITPNFINLIHEEEFEFGYISRSEELVKKQIELNRIATLTWLNELFIANYSNTIIVCGILRVISSFTESTVSPHGYTMAISALSHRDDEIKELGIRAFENWASETSINVLSSIQVQTKWLNQYLDQVIIDIREKLWPTLLEK